MNIDGYEIVFRVCGAIGSATLSPEADTACGHDRDDWTDATPKEVETYRAICADLKRIAREQELEVIDVYTHDGIFCGPVWS